ncbi:MAG: hypothetical protein QOD06_1341 [Candidatus Binatota bacterium]|nr:hypothetical protein [Candidatus Binatota bacterium]
MAALVLGLKLVYVFRYRIDTDEPQHLHVAWSWTQGLLPYRDLFDNHPPLFHLLLAPVVAALGERPDIVPCMRLAMLPLYALTLYATYEVGRAIFSRREGLAAAAVTALMPPFFLKSTEFRADVLWAALWMIALAILVRGRFTRRRCFAFGILLGVVMGTSLKTLLLVFALVCASAFTLAMPATRCAAWRPKRLLLDVIVAALGFVVVPLALVLFFTFAGCLHPFLYCLVFHNLHADLGRWGTDAPWPLLFPALLGPIVMGAAFLARGAPTPGAAARRAFVFLTGAIYATANESFWPLVTAQNYLPFEPLAGIFAAAALLGTARWAARSRAVDHRWSPRMASLVVAGALLIEAAVLLIGTWPATDRTRPHIDYLQRVLRLTSPGDLVMDVKGESIFRRRPFYYALETVTRTLIRDGVIADDVPERLVATRTYVVADDQEGFPSRAREFIRNNYVELGRLRVAGTLLRPTRFGRRRLLPFSVEVPGRYAIVDPVGRVVASVDGGAFAGARFLERGRHVLDAPSHAGPLAIIWAQAVERGFSPFRLEPPA